MKFKALIVLGAIAAASAAYAQPPEGGAPGGGPSPEMRAARQAAMQACAADAKALCDGKSGHEMMMCMRDNLSKASQPCQDAIAKMPRRAPPPQS
jgi:hypothetical protein